MIKVCIFGSGKIGKILQKCLDYTKVELVCFIDNYAAMSQKGEVPIIRPMDILIDNVDYILISSRDFQEEMMEQLEKMKVPSEKVISAYFVEEDMPVIMDIFTEKGLTYVFSYHQQRKIEELYGFTMKRYNNLYLKQYSEHKAAEFIYEKFVMNPELSRDVVFENRKLYRDYLASRICDKTGLFLEFGVFKGKSINYMAKKIGKNTIYGFDSFEGLPEDWLPGYRAGKFDLNGVMPEVEENVILIKGWFEDTLPDFVKEHKNEKCSFINIDCDLYSSTKLVLEQLKEAIVPGTIITFDEYIGHIGWENDEYKAFREWIEETGMNYKYIACAFGGGHQLTVSVAVEII